MVGAGGYMLGLAGGGIAGTLGPELSGICTTSDFIGQLAACKPSASGLSNDPSSKNCALHTDSAAMARAAPSPSTGLPSFIGEQHDSDEELLHVPLPFSKCSTSDSLMAGAKHPEDAIVICACGHVLEDDAAFCKKCGKPRTDVAAVWTATELHQLRSDSNTGCHEADKLLELHPRQPVATCGNHFTIDPSII